MGRSYNYEDEHYSIHVTEQANGHIDLHLQFKRPQPEPPPIERRGGRGERVIVPPHEHMRRQGIHQDDMVVLDQGDGMYEVSSRSEPGAWHHVLIDGEKEICDCTAAYYGRLCRHIKGIRTLLGRPVDAPLPTNGAVLPNAFDFSGLHLDTEPSD